MKILFVDDEKMVLNGLKRALYQTGWKISIADSPQKGLEAIASGTPDVVITDIMMPVMNGVEFLEKVSEGNPVISRFVLSGQANENLILQGSQVSHCWFTKPCSHGLLTQHLRAVEEVNQTFPDSAACQSMAASSPLFNSFTLLKQFMQCVNSNLCELTASARPDINDNMKKAVSLCGERFFGQGDYSDFKDASLKLTLGESQFYALLFTAELMMRLPGLLDEPAVGAKLEQALSRCKDHATPLNALVLMIMALKQDLLAGVTIPAKVSPRQALLFMLHMWNLPYPIIHTVSEKVS
ncbi:response regulator [Alteromonas sp. 1_MG-2023]|uniref:response regulator n=1 Tax=Alteromonas sp. 1_MG-2023 TaxID=3062669 RepID=UPI0026E3A9DB|nr:response regulator [Alteromonas sp. 1_MG-2023]MDO6477198.1 response regulator [Alteromonas sp. 1_MG-2023]